VKRIFTIVLGVAMVATTSTVIKSVQSNARNSGLDRAADAAYRDGLYLGQRDARQGRERHIAVGRWSTPGDRESFKAGYEAGYAKLAQDDEASE